MRKKQGSTAGTEQLQMLVNEAVKSAIDAPAQTLPDKPSGCLPTVIEPVEVERAANRPPFGAWLVNQHQNKRIGSPAYLIAPACARKQRGSDRLPAFKMTAGQSGR